MSGLGLVAPRDAKRQRHDRAEGDVLLAPPEAREAYEAESARRAVSSYQLIVEHREYFATHRRARSFRLLRIANLER